MADCPTDVMTKLKLAKEELKQILKTNDNTPDAEIATDYHGAWSIFMRKQVFTVEPMINLGGNGGDRTGSPKPAHTIA